ncbi:Heat shock 70 kDa protein 14-B [Pseudolycoriella hygida]|uniref:Heat shock 70 kDa protein 14-B n=1 Tax=Pseudolycoriella hygida TaxID=35572 RepID=A0A9Q0MRN7_9DIPT|nr:Heat shock 70 kDa protein 14-B [Pseudolycoriella hygida]
MTTRFGVHMGNTTVCLSILKDNKADIVASKFGDRSSYAVVAAAENDELVIGLPAKQGLVRQSPLTIVNNFQFLNEDLTSDEFIEAKKECVCEISNDPITYTLRKEEIERTLTPFEVAVVLLTNLYENASQAAKSETSLEAVIAVPIHFSAKSRKTIINAAKEAGFVALQMLSEPSACLLAYDIGLDLKEKSNVLVVRIGGLSSDFSLLNVKNGFYQEIGHKRLATFGGNVLSKVLCDFMADEFRNKYKLDPRESRRTMMKLLHHAENCKHILSSMNSAQVFIESLMDGTDWSQSISRARFENVISTQVSNFLRSIEELVAEHSDTVVDKIIFCGGSLKIPKLQSAISNLFPNAQTLSSIPPDEVIALGCAKQASFIGNCWDTEGEHIDMDILTLSSDIIIYPNDDQDNTIVFEKGTPLPNERKFFAKYVDGKVKISVKQNDQINILEECSSSADDLDCMVRAKLQLGGENNLSFVFSAVEKV